VVGVLGCGIKSYSEKRCLHVQGKNPEQLAIFTGPNDNF